MFAIAFAVLGCSGATQPSDNEGRRAVPLGASSWDAKFSTQFQVDLTVLGQPECHPAVDFTLHFEPVADSLRVSPGGELKRQALPEPSYATDSGLVIPRGSFCLLKDFKVGHFELKAWDVDADGVADTIEGHGSGSAVKPISDDVFSTVQFDFDIVGVPDATRPRLTVPQSGSPLFEKSVIASEPLQPSTTIALTNAAGDRIELIADDSVNGGVDIFRTQVVLPLGSAWTVSAQGRDLAGFELDLAEPLSVNEAEDPGLLVPDGFESPPNMSAFNAELVDAIGSMPALNGGKSLFFRDGASALMHLAVPADAKSLRFSVQPFSKTSGDMPAAPEVLLGLIGAAERGSLPASSAEASLSTGHADWPYAGAVQAVSIPFNASGSDLVVQISAPFACRPCSFASAFLIDDLRVE